MIRKVLIVVLAFLLSVPSASAQLFDTSSEYTNPPTPCGTVGVECGGVLFENFATGSYLIAVHVAAPPQEIRYAMSDEALQELFDYVPEFANWREVTAQAEKTFEERKPRNMTTDSGRRVNRDRNKSPYLMDEPKYQMRVFEGDYLGWNGTYDPATVFILNVDDQDFYIIVSVYAMNSTLDYVEWVLDGNDYTVPPLGYSYIPDY